MLRDFRRRFLRPRFLPDGDDAGTCASQPSLEDWVGQTLGPHATWHRHGRPDRRLSERLRLPCLLPSLGGRGADAEYSQVGNIEDFEQFSEERLKNDFGEYGDIELVNVRRCPWHCF